MFQSYSSVLYQLEIVYCKYFKNLLPNHYQTRYVSPAVRGVTSWAVAEVSRDRPLKKLRRSHAI